MWCPLPLLQAQRRWRWQRQLGRMANEECNAWDSTNMDQSRLSVADLPPFRPRAPWWGGDLQTLSSYFRRRARLEDHAHERLVLPLGDGSGDRVVATLTRPA